MRTRIRKQIERASRVAAFCREHPAAVPAEEFAVRWLDESLQRANALAQETLGRKLAITEAVVERRALGERIAIRLRFLAALAHTAGTEALGTPIVITFPVPRRNQVEFLNSARLVVTTAREREELLARFGLPEGYLDELDTALDEFARYLGVRDEAAQAKVSAGKALTQLIGEMRSAINQLGASYKVRFQDDAGALRAWATAVDVRTGPRLSSTGAGGEAPLALPPGSEELGEAMA